METKLQPEVPAAPQIQPQEAPGKQNPQPLSSPKKPMKATVFASLLIASLLIIVAILVVVWAFYANKPTVSKEALAPQKARPSATSTPTTRKVMPGAQAFTILNTDQLPVGFSAAFPKNGLMAVLGSEQGLVNSKRMEGILRFSSSQTVQENYDFYKKYFSQTGWTTSQNDTISPIHTFSTAIKGTTGAGGSANVEIAEFSDTATSTKSVVEVTIFSNSQQ
jgi:hypothetical protein